MLELLLLLLDSPPFFPALADHSTQHIVNNLYMFFLINIYFFQAPESLLY